MVEGKKKIVGTDAEERMIADSLPGHIQFCARRKFKQWLLSGWEQRQKNSWESEYQNYPERQEMASLDAHSADKQNEECRHHSQNNPGWTCCNYYKIENIDENAASCQQLYSDSLLTTKLVFTDKNKNEEE